MQRNNIIVQEYLESLKEDGELDRLMPILLRLMGYKIIRTPTETKGLNQEGKDIIAQHKSIDGITRKIFFEVKGYADRNITEESLAKRDGILDSITAAYFAEYKDLGIPNFNSLPIKVVLVHNGTINTHARNTLNGVIQSRFRDPENEFERWDIYKLTEFFGEYLFGEYLLTDEQSLRLFKKSLALLDQPEYDLRDYKQLISLLLTKDFKVGSRAFNKLFSTLNLTSVILWHNAKECNNILHAINGVAFTLLKTWSYIQKNKLMSRKAVINEFKKLLTIQRDLLASYFDQTIPVALQRDGLFSPDGGFFEEIGYPLRCMNYVAWLVYYFHLENMGDRFDHQIDELTKSKKIREQTEKLFEIIEKNIGTRTPLLDRHSRTIVLVFLFVMENPTKSSKDLVLLKNYLVDIINRIFSVHTFRKRFPSANDNINSLIEFSASGKRPIEYIDDSSMLINILVELFLIFEDEEEYAILQDILVGKLDLQTAYPDWNNPEKVNEAIFDGNITNLTLVESGVNLPKTAQEFKNQIIKIKNRSIVYNCDQVGLKCLRFLSYIYFYNDIPPDEWRAYIINEDV